MKFTVGQKLYVCLESTDGRKVYDWIVVLAVDANGQIIKIQKAAVLCN